MNIILRDYQSESIERCLDYFTNQGTRGLLVLPTGAGKSVVNASLVKAWHVAKSKVLCLSHDIRIIEQNTKALTKTLGFAPAVFCAELDQKAIGDITIASISSFSRYKGTVTFDYIIIDEAHRIAPKELGMYGKVLANYPDAKVLGLTATAYRQGSGLIVDANDSDKLFNDLIYEVPMLNLIERGYLAKYRYIGFGKLKEQEIEDRCKVSKGEYRIEDLELLYSEKNTELARHIHKHAIGQTLVFCVSIADAIEFLKALSKEAGAVGIGLISSEVCFINDVPVKTWREVLGAFKAGQIRYLLNVEMLTTGFDMPEIRTIAVKRAIKSTSLWVQIGGRGSRLSKGKEECLVIDCGCNVARHEKVENITTATAEVMFRNKRNREKAREWSPYRTCPECDHIFERKIYKCPQCGHDIKTTARLQMLKRTALADLSDHWIEQVQDIKLKRHTKPGSPDSVKLIVLYGKTDNLKWCNKATNYFAFDHSNPWVKRKSRENFCSLINVSPNEIPANDAVSWALAQFEADGILADITHIELMTDKNGYTNVTKFISVS